MGNGQSSPQQGLSAKEAAARLRKLGPPPETSSRSTSSIIAGNVFTLFNAIIGVFFVLDLGLGLYADSLFGLIAVINSYIGIRQELKAKATLDELAVLVAPQARVIRCERNARDTALSLWMQGTEPASHDFADIATLLQGDERLLVAAVAQGLPMLAVRHEDLLEQPAAHRRALRAWIGAEDGEGDGAVVRESLPALPVGRWRAYARALPELLAFEEA